MGLKDLFNRSAKKKRRSHFKHLFSIANADGDVESAELDLIIGLAEKFQMRTSEVTKIIKDPTSVQLFTPKSDGVRIEHLYDLVTVMLVDGHIDKRELDLCKSIAGKLGLQQDVIDSLIRDLIEKALKGVAPEKAIEDTLKNYG